MKLPATSRRDINKEFFLYITSESGVYNYTPAFDGIQI